MSSSGGGGGSANGAGEAIGWCLPVKVAPPDGVAAVGNEALIEINDPIWWEQPSFYAAAVGGADVHWDWEFTAVYDWEGAPAPLVSYPAAGVARIELYVPDGYGGYVIADNGTLTLTSPGIAQTLTFALMSGLGAYGHVVLTSEGGGGGGGGDLPPVMMPFIPHIADGFAIDEAGVYARPELATGHSRLRRAYTVPERSVQIAWLLTDAQMAQIDDWYENALEGGSLAFSVPVKRQQSAEINPGAVAWWAAKWAEPPRCAPRRGGLWHYSGTLRLFGDQSDAGPAALPLAAEIALPLYGQARLSVSQYIAAEFSLALFEQRSLGPVGFGVALVEA